MIKQAYSSDMQILSLSHKELECIPMELCNESSAQRLFLQDNNIKKIENLDGLIHLSRIVLTNNQIEKIENLDGLSELRRIFLNNNLIKKIENLECLTNLQRIELSENEIESVVKKSFPPNLKRIDLSNNKIKRILKDSFPYYLEELDLRNNRLQSFPNFLLELNLPIYWNKPNNKKGIYLSGNPFNQSLIDCIESDNFPACLVPEPPKVEVFLSYAWNDDDDNKREIIVDEVFLKLKSASFNIIREKIHLEYGEKVSGYIKRLGEGELVLVFLGDEYLKSLYCMFELYEIARNCKWDKEEFVKRVLPVPIDKIDFSDPKILDGYYEYWELRQKSLEDIIEKRKKQNTNGLYEQMNRLTEIGHNFGKLYKWLVDIHYSSLVDLEKNNYDLLKKTILKRIKNLNSKK